MNLCKKQKPPDNSLEKKHLNTAVIGGGCASISFAHHYLHSNQKTSHNFKWITGVNGIELPMFQTFSNSLAKEDFFDLFRTYGFTPVIDSLENQHITENNNYAPLYEIFSIIEKYGKYLCNTLKSNTTSKNNIKKIIVHGNIASNSDISYTLENSRKETEGVFEQIILATGSSQKYSPILENYGEKLFLTQDILEPGGIQKIFDQIEKNNYYKIVIAGNSHSAFSTCHKFFIESERRGVPLKNGQIEVLSPSPVRIYYENIQEAILDGYTTFHPILDVCPQTGRVFRFGGTRAYAGEIAKKAIKSKNNNAQYPVKITYTDPSQKKYNEIIRNSNCIIQAFGEKTNLPIIEHENGTPYFFSGDITTSTRELIFQNGIILPELHGVGFGFGIQSDTIGEVSYKIRGGKIVFFADYASQDTYNSIMKKNSIII